MTYSCTSYITSPTTHAEVKYEWGYNSQATMPFITWTGTLTLSISHKKLLYFDFTHSMLDN
jgi:hypothetical protein